MDLPPSCRFARVPTHAFPVAAHPEFKPALVASPLILLSRSKVIVETTSCAWSRCKSRCAFQALCFHFASLCFHCDVKVSFWRHQRIPAEHHPESRGWGHWVDHQGRWWCGVVGADAGPMGCGGVFRLHQQRGWHIASERLPLRVRRNASEEHGP